MASTNFVDYSNATPITAAWLNDVNRTQYTILGNPADRAGYIALDTAHAGGTSDAITAAFSVALSSVPDGVIFHVRAGAANTTATPTFTPNSGVVAPATIVKGINTPLVAGDIAGAGHWIILQWDNTASNWILLNPTVAPTGAGALQLFATTSAPVGWLKANGAGVLVSSYGALTTAIYCGDADNATAGWGYRATDSAGTTRSTTGAYLILPDFRGRFARSWADGGTLYDSGRSLWASQADSFASHAHVFTTYVGGPSAGNYLVNSGTAGGPITVANNPVQNTGGTETRPTNLAALMCIKY